MGSGFHFEEGMPLFTMEGRDILVILIVMAAAIALEVFLARKREAWLGLILPGLRLLQVLLQRIVIPLYMRAFTGLGPYASAYLLALAVENIPTLLLLAAYGLCRLGKGWRTRRQLNKTRIDDL